MSPFAFELSPALRTSSRASTGSTHTSTDRPAKSTFPRTMVQPAAFACSRLYFSLMTRIAFLGTGLLGSACVEAAAKGGDEIAVGNRTTDKARPLEQLGARVAPTPAEAVRGAARVHLVLKDDAVVEDVIASLRPGLQA